MRKLRFSLILLGLILFLTGTVSSEENPWSIKINIPEFKLYLYKSGSCHRTFPIAIGKLDTPSPLGEFWIANKVVDPTWYPPDGRKPVPPGPENPLGKYWLGLNVPGYGIHGNSAAWSIGNPATSGCFRLHNMDIQKLFKLAPVGTPVLVSYETVNAVIDESNLMWLELFPDVYHLVDREAEIRRVITSLNWIYSPHWKALHELFRGKSLTKIQVPRVIKIEGEIMDKDGFYWENDVYLAKNNLKTLTGTDHNMVAFPDYFQLEPGIQSDKTQKYSWDQVSNTLKVFSEE